MKKLTLLLLIIMGAYVPAHATIRFVADTGNITTNGVNLIAAEIAAVCGDTITLVAGATYFGGVSNDVLLQDKSPCSTQTTICTGDAGGCITTNLPPYGSRVVPGLHAQYMAKVTSDGLPAFHNAPGAHHWTLQGLEMTDSFGGTGTGFLTLNLNLGEANTVADIQAMGHFIVDRCFLHPSDIDATHLKKVPITDVHSGWGINIAGDNNIVIGNDIRGYGGYYPNTGQTLRAQAYGVAVATGGPILIENNYIEAAFTNIFVVGPNVDPIHTGTISNPTPTSATLSTVLGLSVGDIIALEYEGPSPNNCAVALPTKCFQTAQVDTISGTNITYHPVAAGHLDPSHSPDNGGAAQWNGLEPHDVVATHNTLFKLYEWQSAPFATGGNGSSKGSIETKQCINCRYEGNVIDGACGGTFNLETQGSTSNNATPWATINGMTIRSNLMKGDGGGWTLQGLDSVNSSTTSQNILITNNFVQQYPLGCAGNTTQDYAMTADYATNITYSHNTFRANPVGLQTIVRGNSAGTYPPPVVDYFNGQRGGAYNFAFKDNIVPFSRIGLVVFVAGVSDCVGAKAIGWGPSGAIVGSTNVVVQYLNEINDPTGTCYFPSGQVVANDAAVGFVNIAASDAGGDYHLAALASNSPYKGTASDGGDPGVNFAALDAALGPLAYGNVAGVPKGWLAGQ